MIRYGDLKIETCRDVYEPAEDTFLLADNLEVGEGERVLEIGTGTGLVAIKASEKADVTATDINPAAVECARKNAVLNGSGLRVLQGDLFDPVRGEKFDVILFNTPYLPVGEEDITEGSIDLAWNGGPDGRRVIDRFLDDVAEHLKPGGRIQLVQSSLSDTKRTLERLRNLGFDAEVTASERYFFEEIVLIRAVMRGARDPLPVSHRTRGPHHPPCRPPALYPPGRRLF
ncbi:methyltransferase [Methanothermobacter sp. THM-2]|uniref:Predicted methyltransferase n=2 Tax=Methanobacteriaceae TaxID=2159 RepID=D9PYI6_METTM|nr:predicted methyltransferase [Methanothermobacter marburgensis str. Marburg]QHN08873.1 methyltransferase [Methanothermobacter sp. THM-2]WBF10770.1 methyltransferase [Methanothermobacter marburgensis]